MTIPSFRIGSVVSGPPDAREEFQVSIAPNDLQSDDPLFAGPLSFSIAFERHGREVGIEVGNLATQLVLTCVRCATTFEAPLTIARALASVPLDGVDEDCPVILDRHRGEADASLWLRAEIIAATDPLPVCHAECQGRCPTCGANKNTDSCSCPPLPEEATPLSALQDAWQEDIVDKE